MSVESLDMAGIRTELLTKLGSNTLDVELVAGDLNACIIDALRVLNREHPPTAWGTLNVGSGPTYAMPITAPGLYGIIDVDWAAGPNANCTDDPFAYSDVVMASSGLAGGYYGRVGQVLEQQTYMAQAREIMGRKPDWETRWVRTNSTTTLMLMLSDLPASAQVMYEYVWHLTADDNANTGVSRIPSSDLDWVVRYALARAKQILGRVLRKYSGGVNMPDGGTEQLDGTELTQEGQQEQSTLEDVMHRRRRNILPRTG